MAETRLVHGLAELKANLAALSGRVAGEITTRALLAGAKPIRDDARRRAPLLAVDTPYRERGALRSGIQVQPMRWNHVKVRVRSRTYIFLKRARGRHWAGNPNYWWLVEFGTSKARARPFLRPAFESQKFNALAALSREYRRGIELAVRGLHKYKPSRLERKLGYLLAT